MGGVYRPECSHPASSFLRLKYSLYPTYIGRVQLVPSYVDVGRYVNLPVSRAPGRPD